ncbi:MAG: EVE domain-containing protein [Ignavibacteria bacterium]|nr:EVE domain-containing protein [Ignavibacteria bacterium]MBP7092530.1 EVE domain-containing protein [Candidatus Kapabacteria bacterium]MBK6420044.1 EVE domain-containing protein [Ignavibacteria bacterium]MBK7034224.1 EVE domain-containing protein [Ignavibacteria bacterium]MBK7185052.1 EVE domain-containing protein [Ignavibacteria bacterium]
MKYWLVKSEPEVYSWDQFVKDKRTFWDGIRNYQARNNMREMDKGDQVIFYHSGDERSAVGIAEVVKTAYQDPTTEDEAWVVVDLKPVRPLKNPVTLATIKSTKGFENIALVKQGRLSVLPLTKKEFELIQNSEE